MKQRRNSGWIVACMLLSTATANAATPVLPVTVAATTPTTCQVGQLFFASAATAGESPYGCTKPNVWTRLGGTSGVNLATQLRDFAPSGPISGTSATFGSSANSVSPTVIGGVNPRYVFTNGVTFKIVSGSGDGTLYFYVLAGKRTLGFNDANAYSCTNCETPPVSGISAFPDGSIPLYTINVARGTFAGYNDYRPWLTLSNFQGVMGVAIKPVNGANQVSLSETVDSIEPGPFTVPGSACGHFEIETSTASETWSLPQPGVGGMMTNGCAIAFKASASGSVVLQPSSATINGATSYTIASGHACRVVTDGSNYFTEVCP